MISLAIIILTIVFVVQLDRIVEELQKISKIRIIVQTKKTGNEEVRDE